MNRKELYETTDLNMTQIAAIVGVAQPQISRWSAKNYSTEYRYARRIKMHSIGQKRRCA